MQSLLSRYGGVRKVLVDGSQPGFRELKERYHDSYVNYHQLDTQLQDRLIHTAVPLIVAVNWQRHRKEMLEKAYTALSKQMFRIEPRFNKLVTALRTATTSQNDLTYDKEKTSFSDVLDSFLQLSLLLKNK